MDRLPKIALVRLKANPEASQSASPPSGPDAFQGAEHPDANLLAAFVEKTLTDKERTAVLDHLSRCAECREVAAFTLPAEVVAAEPARATARRRWSPWLVLRWGAMAAVLASFAVVVVLHPGLRKGHREISEEARAPIPMGNVTGAPQSVPAPSIQTLPETPQARVKQETRKSDSEVAAMMKASGPQGDVTPNDQVARAKAKQQVTLMAASRPPATLRAETVPPVNVEREEAMGGNAVTAGALSAPSAPPAPGVTAAVASEEAAKADVAAQAGSVSLRATSQSLDVVGGIAGSTPAEAPAPKPAPRVTAQASTRKADHASMLGMRASPVDVGAGSTLALWSVKPNGQVQRSTDGGNTWEQIPVSRDVKLRAIAAVGNDVWTGGTGGVLFHSVDGGATWNRAGISFGGNPITETIVGIQLRDPQHLTVNTVSGSQWVSEDAGQHWQKQP